MFVYFTGRSARQIGENLKRLAWPELVGKQGTFVVDYIKQSTGRSICISFFPGFLNNVELFRFNKCRYGS